MKFGNCISYKDINRIKILKKTGFDYVEIGLSSLYTAEKSEIENFLGALDKNNIKCEAVNVIFPGGIKLTGENAEFEKAENYIAEIFEKTKSIGFKYVVFGSGGARRVPDGFPMEEAKEQLIKIINDYLIPAAEKYDFTVVVEELNKAETNIINTIDEAEYIVEKINNPKIKLLADLYHIGLENEDISKLSEKGSILAHCHIANPYNKRSYPQKSDSAKAKELYKIFFENLKKASYQKGISIEGSPGGLENINEIKIPDWVKEEDKLFYAESKKSLEFIKSY